jgi:hypothetical protein
LLVVNVRVVATGILIVKVPAPVYVAVAAKVASPATISDVAVGIESVPANPVQLSPTTVTVAARTETPVPELASKYTKSPVKLVGAEAPRGPPDVADQLLVLDQFPVPPETQYRFAITQPFTPADRQRLRPICLM